MDKQFLLNESPRILFLLQPDGFQLKFEQSRNHMVFYAYSDIQYIKLKRGWFPRFATYMRALTWVLNGVPYFPDAASCNTSSLHIQFKKNILLLNITSISMAKKAKEFKQLLEIKRAASLA